MIFHPTRNPRDYLNHWGSEEKSSGTGFKVSASLAATSAIPDTNLCTNSALNRWNSVEWPRFRLNSVDSIKFQKIFDSIRRFSLSFRSQQKIRKFSEKSEIPLQKQTHFNPSIPSYLTQPVTLLEVYMRRNHQRTRARFRVYLPHHKSSIAGM